MTSGEGVNLVIPVSIPFLKKDFTYLLLERGKRREEERERNIDQLPLACPTLGTWPASQACVLTGNQTHDVLVGMMPKPLSHTSEGQGSIPSFVKQIYKC